MFIEGAGGQSENPDLMIIIPQVAEEPDLMIIIPQGA